MNIANIDDYRQKRPHRHTLVAVRFSPQGDFLISADQSGEIIVGLVGRGSTGHIAAPHLPVTGAWFSEDGQRLFVGQQWGLLLVYHFPGMTLEAEINLKPSQARAPRILSGTSKPILDWVVLCISPKNDANIYVILENRDFFTLRRETLEILPEKHLSGTLFECAAASPDGELVFLGDDLGYLYRLRLPLLELETFAWHHEELEGIDWPKRTPTTVDTATGIAGLSLTRQSQWVASTSRAGGVQVWPATETQGSSKLQDFRPLAARRLPQAGWLRGVCFLPHSSRLALGADNGVIEIWDLATGEIIQLAKCPEAVRCLEASPDGSLLAAGCEDGSLFLFPVHDQQSHRTPAAGLSVKLRGFLGRCFNK